MKKKSNPTVRESVVRGNLFIYLQQCSFTYTDVLAVNILVSLEQVENTSIKFCMIYAFSVYFWGDGDDDIIYMKNSLSGREQIRLQRLRPGQIK